MKHCNIANVWGLIEKHEKKSTHPNNNPYIETVIDCQHTKFGNVSALCFVWGETAVANFNTSYKTGNEIRLIGAMQQYKGRHDTLKTTFNIFRLKPGPIAERKAAFILVGEVEELDGDRLDILIKHPSSEARAAREENIIIHLPQAVLLSLDRDPEEGALVCAKGYLMHQEDDFGGETAPQRPVVKKLEIL